MFKHHGRNKVGILGPFSFGNLGNAALQESVARQVNRYLSGSEIYGCYINPDSAIVESAVKPFPINRTISERRGPSPLGASEHNGQPEHLEPWRRWIKQIPLAVSSIHAGRRILQKARAFWAELAFFVRAFEFARESKILIVGMGGVIDDVWGGPWADPYSLFIWAILGKLAKTPFVFMSVGAERIETKLGRFFLRNALTLATYRSYRDLESKEKAESMGVRGPNLVFPDLAFSLAGKDKDAENLFLQRTSQRLVGISPMAFLDPRSWPTKDWAGYFAYLSTLATLAEWLLQRGYRVVLFATQIRMDQAPLAELKRIILNRVPCGIRECVTEANLRDVDELVSLAGQMDFVVSSRLHGVILPYLAGTPVLAISHSSKINSLMEDMGLQAYCADIGSADFTSLQQQILAIETHQDKLRHHIRTKVGAYQQALEEQFRSVFGSIERRAG